MLKVGELLDSDSRDLELFASRIHDIWVKWATNIMNSEQISDDRKMRWKSLMIPYKDLSETEKEKDREMARYVLEGTL